ncbi:MAG: hypothetical protein Q8L27_00570 [archaeon]|nr:hypothetical protein [archaeon]
MKFLFLITLLIISVFCYSQDCELIEKFKRFHGVEVGKKFPDSLRKYMHPEYNKVREDTTFYLWENVVSANQGFKKWLDVGGQFSYMGISTIKSGQVYMLLLQRSLNGIDSSYLKEGRIPLFYSIVSDELKNLFGNKTKEYIDTGTVATTLNRDWECDKLKIQLSMSYEGILNSYSLTIIDKILDNKRKFGKYTN